MTSAPPDDRVRREVVSFVRRSARMNPSQMKAFQAHKDLLLDIQRGARSTSVAAQAPLDLARMFGRVAPLIVEIGSGAGHSVAAAAAANPATDILAFEVFEPSIASTMAKVASQGLTNVRLVLADGVQGLTYLVSPHSLAEVRVWFPDPWHKARHHKRRLVTPDFGSIVADRIEPDGVLRLATDWQDYADAMREALDGHPRLVNANDGWAPRFAERPLTKYEQRGIDAGRTIRDLEYRLR